MRVALGLDWIVGWPLWLLGEYPNAATSVS
jgi:hypothetical protein